MSQYVGGAIISAFSKTFSCLRENLPLTAKALKLLLTPLLRIAAFFVWNDFGYFLRTKVGEKNKTKIAIIYMVDYFHHYLEGAMRCSEKFTLRHSRYFLRKDLNVPFFNPRDTSTMDVVLPESSNFLVEGFTKRHRVLMRVQHSPGFSMKDPISPYLLIKHIDGKLMIPKLIWNLALEADCLDEETRKIKEVILRDGTPIFLTSYDPKMNALYNLPHRIERKENTVLVAVNWKTFKSSEDIQLLLKAIRFMKSEKMTVRVKLHPLINLFLGSFVEGFRRQLNAVGAEMLSDATALCDMADLYDEHEFILTDGSGSVYEAIARGCKALVLYGFKIQQEGGNFYPAVKMKLLPKTVVWNIQNHPGNQCDMEWLMRFYGSSLTRKDVAPLVAAEIEEAFQSWSRESMRRNK